MLPFQMFVLTLAAAAAGAINAIAGGGTLITFPALLFFGTPPVIANATSTLALVIGTSGSLYGYRQHLPIVKPWLWRFAPISIIGGLIGGVLLTFTSNKLFSKLVPFLILFATALFLAQGLLRRIFPQNRTTRERGHFTITIARLSLLSTEILSSIGWQIRGLKR